MPLSAANGVTMFSVIVAIASSSCPTEAGAHVSVGDITQYALQASLILSTASAEVNTSMYSGDSV
jgi:hypothetical protein